MVAREGPAFCQQAVVERLLLPHECGNDDADNGGGDGVGKGISEATGAAAAQRGRRTGSAHSLLEAALTHWPWKRSTTAAACKVMRTRAVVSKE